MAIFLTKTYFGLSNVSYGDSSYKDECTGKEDNGNKWFQDPLTFMLCIMKLNLHYFKVIGVYDDVFKKILLTL